MIKPIFIVAPLIGLIIALGVVVLIKTTLTSMGLIKLSKEICNLCKLSSSIPWVYYRDEKYHEDCEISFRTALENRPKTQALGSLIAQRQDSNQEEEGFESEEPINPKSRKIRW